MKEGESINGYVVEKKLSSAPACASWMARAHDGSPAFLKALDLGLAADWRAIDVFKREIDALRGLSHPAIPRLIDSFDFTEATPEGDRRFFVLVTEFVEGENLRNLVGGGRRFTEDEITRVFAALVEILDYLGSLRPPVVHRDVNPKNIVLRPDGSIALVDFSGVTEAARKTMYASSTMIGTAGYVPLEQLSGRASARSDLYAAAATAVFLLTRREPSDLPLVSMKPDWRSAVDAAPGLAYVISNWLEPDEAARDLTPRAALDLLSGKTTVPSAVSAAAASELQGGETEIHIDLSGDGVAKSESLPSDSRVKLVEGEGFLSAEIPKPKPGFEMLFGAFFLTFWFGFLVVWCALALTFFFPMALFSIPFWVAGVFVARQTVVPYMTSYAISLDRTAGLGFQRKSIGTKKSAYPFQDVGVCKITTLSSRGGASEISLEAGVKTLKFGRGLSRREQEAIVLAIRRIAKNARPKS